MLYITKDYTLKLRSLTKIAVSGDQPRRSINVGIDGNKHLHIEKNIAVPCMITSYHEQSEIWITNLQSGNHIIPKGMYVGLYEPPDEGHLCVLSDTPYVPGMKREMSDGNKRQENPLMDCSLMILLS
ncbi:transposon Ty3-I Gag-Pol polyprotein [Trichonephila clavata]|uniref:Transposon Ty3-I Gag-Pol polyprotein n=1 Tax=Trichonephila clavata TaxID=2740835 RepID=A0A8X6H0H9_TRICU|nr:transposon Ty3-I Gag-Pol polyprotein [Trichonephila clavata]